jgi:hypothetical protein
MSLTALLAISVLTVQATQPAISVAPDFSGTWKIDRELTNWEHLRNLEDLTLEISQNPSQLLVKRIIVEQKHKPRTSELTYHPDGRGEKVSRLFSDRKFKSKTIWVNQTMVTKFTVSEYEGTTRDFYYFDFQETWSLSDDKKVLTISTEVAVRNVPRFLRNVITSSSYRKVFRKIG